MTFGFEHTPLNLSVGRRDEQGQPHRAGPMQEGMQSFCEPLKGIVSLAAGRTLRLTSDGSRERTAAALCSKCHRARCGSSAIVGHTDCNVTLNLKDFSTDVPVQHDWRPQCLLIVKEFEAIRN